jgi:arginine deiminase
MTPSPAMGATSEVGALQTVLLHRPGNELRRLTPRNNDQLPFDGVPWVDRA